MLPDYVKPVAEWCAAVVELIGVGLIVVLTVYALVFALVQLIRRFHGQEVYRQARLRLAHGILLGLEFLVAADIIHTVAVDLTFETVGVLAIVVLIRTFLSFSLEVEISGRWPWQGQGGHAEGANSA